MTDLEELVAAQNVLSQERNKAMSGTTVIIVKENRYNDAHDRAKLYKEGDSLTTRGWYAQDLVDADVARWPDGAAAPLALGAVAEEAVATFAGVKGMTDTALAGLAAVEHTWETVNAASVADLCKLPGVGPKLAAKLKAEAETHGQASTG